MLVETRFLARGNHFLPVSQMLFKEFFIRIFIFWSRRKSIAFYFELFFPASQYHYLNYSEFKTLITAIGNDFIWFFRYSCQRKKFFCLVETYSETCSPFLLMETDFLSTWINTPLLGDLFLLVDTIGEIQFLKDNLMYASGNWFSGK